MRSLSSNLISHLATNKSFNIADCYTFTLASGTVYRWTTWDADVNGFTHGGPILSRTGARFAAGRETSTVDITMGGAGFTLGGVKLTLAAVRGVFYGAKVKIERLFMPAPGDASLGAIPWFEGYVASVMPSSTEVKLTVKSRQERLNIPMPRRTFQPACGYVLYDSNCGVSRALHMATGATAAGTTSSFLAFTDAHSDDYWKGGVVTITSGPMAGQTRTAIDHVNIAGVSGVTLDLALPSVPANGTAFEIARGCNKASHNPDGTPGDCIAKFDNLPRFGGFPFVPKPESAR